MEVRVRLPRLLFRVYSALRGLLLAVWLPSFSTFPFLCVLDLDFDACHFYLLCP